MKKNIPIIVGISLPIVMIIVIFLMTVIPSSSIKPKHDFVFSYKGDSYNQVFENDYIVNNGEISLKATNITDQNLYNRTKQNAPKLYVYSFDTDSLKEITLEESKRYELDKGPTSPDGYTVDFNYRGNYSIANEIFGGSNRNYNAYIVKGEKAKGIYLSGISSRNYYGNDSLNFIGWITN